MFDVMGEESPSMMIPMGFLCVIECMEGRMDGMK
jgi:hypothetical protein